MPRSDAYRHLATARRLHCGKGHSWVSPGVIAGSALLIDYMLNIAVGISAGVSAVVRFFAEQGRRLVSFAKIVRATFCFSSASWACAALTNAITIAVINTLCSVQLATLLHEPRIAKRARHWNSNCERQGRRYAAARSCILLQ